MVTRANRRGGEGSDADARAQREASVCSQRRDDANVSQQRAVRIPAGNQHQCDSNAGDGGASLTFVSASVARQTLAPPRVRDRVPVRARDRACDPTNETAGTGDAALISTLAVILLRDTACRASMFVSYSPRR